MKLKIFLLPWVVLLLLQTHNKLQAQDYVPFPTDNVIWSEVYSNIQPFQIDTYQYGISGDTLINSQLYRKIYRLYDTIYPVVPGSYCGAIREDSSKRIFSIGCDCVYPGSPFDEEVLLYDFSKAVGDTIFVGVEGIGPLGYMIIDSIGSVLIDGNYRKTFHFTSWNRGRKVNSNWIEDYWIEGIGSTRSLFSPLQYVTTGYGKWELICFNQENEVKYLNPKYNSCFPLLTGANSINMQNEAVKIYPHPVTSISVIELMSSTGSYFQHIAIYNVLGQQVNAMNITAKTKVFINRADFKPGLYIYRLSGQHTKPETGKIIFK
ncbi:MAG: T9SS type A sorting domain-containing protein [Bacteroidales bacterium]|nr:T9SS type A sorting domain-containing protein [Bacteroidales bacterium]